MEWLEGLGLQEYTEDFRRFCWERIEDLHLMTTDDIIEITGTQNKGHMRRLEAAVKALSTPSAPGAQQKPQGSTSTTTQESGTKRKLFQARESNPKLMYVIQYSHVTEFDIFKMLLTLDIS